MCEMRLRKEPRDLFGKASRFHAGVECTHRARDSRWASPTRITAFEKPSSAPIACESADAQSVRGYCGAWTNTSGRALAALLVMTRVSSSPLDRIRKATFHDAAHGYDVFGLHPPTLARAAKLAAPIYEHYFRVDSRGIENIPTRGAAILVANHSGMLPVDAAVSVSTFCDAPTRREFLVRSPITS